MLRRWLRRRKLRRLLATRTLFHDCPWGHPRMDHLTEVERHLWICAWYDRFYAIRDLHDTDPDAAMAEMDRMRERLS